MTTIDKNAQHAHAHSKHHAQEDSNHFLIPLLLISAFAVIELLGGWWTGSLALLGDAWHMVSDIAALGLAWFAASHTKKVGATRHASGMSHAEIIASIINAILMLLVVAWIVAEAIQRFKHPQAVAGVGVMMIAFLGLVVNIVVAKQLHGGHQEDNLNHRAAFLHVLGDLLGSIAALVAGAVIYFTGWLAIDPILSIFISVLILLSTLSLIKDIWHTVYGKKVPSKQAHPAHHHKH